MGFAADREDRLTRGYRIADPIGYRSGSAYHPKVKLSSYELDFCYPFFVTKVFDLIYSIEHRCTAA